MNKDYLQWLVAAGLLFFAYKLYAGVGTVAARQGATTAAGEIPNTALPGQAGYGWRYFADGTVIDPKGAYYQNGIQLWSPQ